MATTQSARDRIQGRGIPLPGDDIDTDRIIPARYLREITFETLGRYAFQDERFDEMGSPREHPLNDPRFTGGCMKAVRASFRDRWRARPLLSSGGMNPRFRISRIQLLMMTVIRA